MIAHVLQYRAVRCGMIGLALLAAAQCWNEGSARVSAQEQIGRDAQKKAERIAVGETPWVGVGGCAAAACHGGEVDKPRGEYTTWISHDPHARAYSVLFGEASLAMARRLAGGNDAKITPPSEDPRCLACHAPTGPKSERSAQLLGDGVGCEACHGAAEHWSTSHATVNWRALTREQRAAKRQELGMTNMRDPLVRAQQCAPCHVGHGDADVTHELIAAGHPRLSFELGAFHAKMPKHWDNAQERREDPAFEAKLWAVGQATSAAVYMDLVAARAEHPGIEFANYDCYACHHALHAPSWRQAESEQGLRMGRMRELDWYQQFELFEPLLPAEPGELPNAASWMQLQQRRALGLQGPKAQAFATSFAANLRGWAKSLSDAPWNAETVDVAMKAIVSRPPLEPDWDAATQWYLAVVALERARLDYQGDKPLSATDEKIQAELKTLKAMLDFPAAGDGPRVNSPRDFDPAAFRERAEGVARLIEERTPTEEAAP